MIENFRIKCITEQKLKYFRSNILDAIENLKFELFVFFYLDELSNYVQVPSPSPNFGKRSAELKFKLIFF
jgi:hypothetical protein